MNAGSKLTYPVRFAGKRRIVRLEGEAYFDVVADEEHPFVVQTHLGEITVLGTAFNVNAYADAPVCYTTLVYGKVNFSTLNAETITLHRVNRLLYLPIVQRNARWIWKNMLVG